MRFQQLPAFFLVIFIFFETFNPHFNVNLYLHSYWRDLHVRSWCICIDKWVAITKSIQAAVLESLHFTHSASCGMISLVSTLFVHKCRKKGPNGTDIGENLKPVISASKWKPHENCSEPIKEIQIHIEGPFTWKKGQDIHFLARTDRFSKYQTVELFDKNY